MVHNSKNPLTMLGPGILVAATGVGAGDLATSAFTGSALGLTILWAVLLGAFFKFVLSEGLARWQLATGSTLLEGFLADREGSTRGRSSARIGFLAYLIVWSFLVSAALTSAIGVTCHAIYPLFGPEAVQTNKIVYGILHSILAVVLVRLGGYWLFEKVMSACVGLMFVIVVFSACALRPNIEDLATGLLVPRIPEGGISWTIALIGGVGGTVTVLSYGYWIREEGREGKAALNTCRLDLASGYIVTAVFGLGMVIIGHSLETIEGGGAKLIVNIAQQLESTLGSVGPMAKWLFLIGAWGAVFSSLLGVWQSVPYMFADVWALHRGPDDQASRVNTRSLPYRGYLYGLAFVPLLGLLAFDFQTMQKTYAVVGALFVPLLAIVLWFLNSHSTRIGKDFKNSWMTSFVLVAIVLFFALAGVLQVQRKVFSNNTGQPTKISTVVTKRR